MVNPDFYGNSNIVLLQINKSVIRKIPGILTMKNHNNLTDVW